MSKSIPDWSLWADAELAKGQRIRAALSPYLSQKRIRIRNTPGGRMLVQQTRADSGTPGLGGAYGDGPDAVATARPRPCRP